MKPGAIHETLSLIFYLGRVQGEEMSTQTSFLPYCCLLDKLLPILIRCLHSTCCTKHGKNWVL